MNRRDFFTALIAAICGWFGYRPAVGRHYVLDFIKVESAIGSNRYWWYCRIKFPGEERYRDILACTKGPFLRIDKWLSFDAASFMREEMRNSLVYNSF
jgi:hypothetical protein